jgi:hypothetical protein
MVIEQMIDEFNEMPSSDDRKYLAMKIRLEYSKLNDNEKEVVKPLFKKQVHELLKKSHAIDEQIIKLGLAKPEDIPGYGLYK